MGKLKKEGLKYIFCFTTGIISGVLIGSILMSILICFRMDLLYEEIAYLKNTIEDKNNKLEKLEKSINNANIILKNTEIILDFKGDEIDKMEIEKAIKEKYNTLLGKDVKTLDADMLVQVIDKRIFKIEDKEYRLTVNKLILTETLQIMIKVELIE
ncbi:hypothetical protein J2Z76_000126 [Sedimentibacter acidaminivorans]|uniref:Sporulation membrane protein YtrI C-terminal domain-containing protein n=1 Tax=Sedimentibacter acidaminivorans TaxID=913099 RepID=A0ABS4G9B7_9FIRM|nr:hypothetical protein [Sedimentibacter acidaminivorans]MBP1924273.1 hypothetical protein [Sedimentibacter acidaminivorans]